METTQSCSLARTPARVLATATLAGPETTEGSRALWFLEAIHSLLSYAPFTFIFRG